MKKEYAALERKAKKLEEKYGSLENFVKQTTKPSVKHKMKMKGSFDLNDEFLKLEKIDLEDFWRFEKEYGEFS